VARPASAHARRRAFTGERMSCAAIVPAWLRRKPRSLTATRSCAWRSTTSRDGSMATPPAWSERSIPIWPSDPRTTLLPPRSRGRAPASRDRERDRPLRRLRRIPAPGAYARGMEDRQRPLAAPLSREKRTRHAGGTAGRRPATHPPRLPRPGASAALGASAVPRRAAPEALRRRIGDPDWPGRVRLPMRNRAARRTQAQALKYLAAWPTDQTGTSSDL
jgi:hypothetical protein